MSHDTNSQPDHRSNPVRPRTVLAIASAGGHWIQLRRLHPAFDGSRIIYATTRESYRGEVEADGAEFRVVPDCNRWQKIKLVKSAIKILFLLMKEKPDVVVSTGAAPGYFAIRLGKLLGKKTVWVDSIANAEVLSLSGQKAGKHVNHWITQWKHLAKPEGPYFFGNVLGDETKEAIANDSSIIAKHQPSDAVENQPLVSANPETTGEDGSATSQEKTATCHAVETKADQPLVAANPATAGEDGSEHSVRPLRIFVTVGTDLPFDRLVKTLDTWASTHPGYEIYAQIGETSYKPRNISYCRFIEPPDFKKRFQESDLIISHAGMGTILSSLSFQKPLLVMPRIAAKGEHRNEHQLATAKHLQAINKVNVAQDEKELLSTLECLGQSSKVGLPVKASISRYATRGLTSKLSEFIRTI